MRSNSGQLGVSRALHKEGVLTVVVIIADYHLFYLSVLAHLTPEIFVESVEMVLQLARVHLVLRVIGWILVKVWEKDCLRVRGFDMFSRASITMSASANFVVE